MFKEIFKTQYALFEYSEESALMIHTWFDSTATMSWNEFQSILQEYLKLLDDYLPSSVIINATNFKYLIIPEEQEWMDKNINQKGVAMNIKKFGFVISKDQIAQISNEQVMGEEQGQKIHTKYFSDLNEALNWIKQ